MQTWENWENPNFAPPPSPLPPPKKILMGFASAGS